MSDLKIEYKKAFKAAVTILEKLNESTEISKSDWDKIREEFFIGKKKAKNEKENIEL